MTVYTSYVDCQGVWRAPAGARRSIPDSAGTAPPGPSGYRPTYNDGVTTDALPGADLIEEGLADARGGRDTVAALLVSIGAPRLVHLGIDLPHGPALADPEHRLYLRLAQQYGDAAHSRYNALIRRLVSFERACACAR
jgi:hypothetical protein